MPVCFCAVGLECRSILFHPTTAGSSSAPRCYADGLQMLGMIKSSKTVPEVAGASAPSSGDVQVSPEDAPYVLVIPIFQNIFSVVVNSVSYVTMVQIHHVPGFVRVLLQHFHFTRLYSLSVNVVLLSRAGW